MNKVMDNIDKLIEQGRELSLKHEDLRNKILSNPDIPQEMKDVIINLQNEMEVQRMLDEKNREENKNKKIIGYNPETFDPIYE